MPAAACGAPAARDTLELWKLYQAKLVWLMAQRDAVAAALAGRGAPLPPASEAGRAPISAAPLFFKHWDPTDVDALIAKYRDVGVGASELLIAVQKKYARDQPQRRANQFSV